MRRFLVATAVFLQLGSYACDVCGSRIAYTNWQFGQNFTSSVQLRYQQTVFHSEHFADGESNLNHSSEELYRILALEGRYAITERWMVVFNTPVVFNRYRDVGTLNTIEAIGDIQLSAVYRVYKADAAHPLTWDIGLGLKTPTGEWQSVNSFLPASALPGTGSWDVSMMTSIGYKLNESTALGLTAVGIIPGENPWRKRFGEQANVNLGVQSRLYKAKADAWTVSGLCGYSYSLDRIDTQAYGSESFTVDGSEGQFHSGFAGIQWSNPSLSFGLQGSIPMVQNFADGKVKAEPTAQFNIKYNFN